MARRHQAEGRTLSRLGTTVAATGILLLTGCGLTAPRSSDGWADLDSLGVFDVDNTMTLSIGPSLLHFAARHMDEDPETRALLEGLDGVRIRIYEVDGSAVRVAGRLDRMSARLQDDGWSPVAVVREPGETVHMLVKSERGRMTGLTVLVLEDDEAVVVNLMGELAPENFTDTMAALDVDVAPRVQVAAN